MGSTTCIVFGDDINKDHPHIHGEHLLVVFLVLLNVGSPPYTWGAPQVTSFPTMTGGITPIYMGSTPKCWRKISPSRDHPHIHGEHFFTGTNNVASQGSPPYTWGAPGISLDVRADHGITPIYMGSTNQTSNRDDGNQDHPHIHGEHADGVFTDKTTQGSPPYTWGARRWGIY